jgi:hypothetical protein
MPGKSSRRKTSGAALHISPRGVRGVSKPSVKPRTVVQKPFQKENQKQKHGAVVHGSAKGTRACLRHHQV